MITIVYTGDADNSKPNLSLGGLVGSNLVPNNRINNIFENVSYSQIRRNQNIDTKAIGLKNTENVTINGSLGIIKEPNADYEIEIAFVALNDLNQMEAIASSKDLPYNAVFMSADVTDTDFSNAIGFDIDPTKAIGLWIKRTISPTDSQADFCTLDTANINSKRNFIVKIEY